MTPLAAAILRNKSFRILYQLLFAVFTLPLYYLGFIIPKDPNLWIMANSFGFKDNARYLYTYIQENNPEITPLWIAKGNRLQDEKNFSRSWLSLSGIWLQYRAGVVFLSTGQNDVARFTLARKNIIQLWHGIPIKRILLDSDEIFPLTKSSPLLQRAILVYLKRNFQLYSLVIASSKVVQNRLISAFGLPDKKIAITGYPRHDVLLENAASFQKIILYAPTWRSDIGDAQEIAEGICNEQFIQNINALGYEFWLSIHPLNIELVDLFKQNSNINHISNDIDLYTFLASVEILITDYSSIAIDFLLLNRKIIFYTPDADNYLQDRGIYPEYNEIFRKNGMQNATQVLTKIQEENSKPDISPDSFFHYKDTGSRARIVDLVKKMIHVN